MERTPGSFREQSPAWARIQPAYHSAIDIDTTRGNTEAMQLVVPTEFQSWVAATSEVHNNNHANGEMNGNIAHDGSTTTAVNEEAKSATTGPVPQVSS